MGTQVTKKVKLTPAEKRRMLVDAVHMCYKVGGCATAFVGRPLSFYNYNSIFVEIHKMSNENIEQGGDSFFDYAPEFYSQFLENNTKF